MVHAAKESSSANVTVLYEHKNTMNIYTRCISYVHSLSSRSRYCFASFNRLNESVAICVDLYLIVVCVREITNMGYYNLLSLLVAVA